MYALNERNHWVFRAYDLANELWARLVFRGVRRRAGRIDAPIRGRDAEARLRCLSPDDLEAFAALLARFDFRYGPPHPRDRATAARVLRRTNHVPLGLFYEGRLVGYLLVRLFFPRRAVTAIWSLPVVHNKRFSVGSGLVTSAFTRAEGLDDYITVPLDNTYSLKAALGAGWRIIRTNRRFHVLKRR